MVGFQFTWFSDRHGLRGSLFITMHNPYREWHVAGLLKVETESVYSSK